MISKMLVSLLSVLLLVVLLFTISCNSDDPQDPIKTEPLYVTISDESHHLGDNEGSEGTEFSANFETTSSYEIAILSITFLFPNDAGQSGPEIDSPPEIQINGQKVGLSVSDFPENSECISVHREYDCDITIFIGIADNIKIGNNTIRIISKGAAHDGDDDFVFTNLKIELTNNNI